MKQKLSLRGQIGGSSYLIDVQGNIAYLGVYMCWIYPSNSSWIHNLAEHFIKGLVGKFK